MIVVDGKEVNDPRVYECIFIFALYWSIGAALTEESRVAFDSFIKMISDWPSIGAFTLNLLCASFGISITFLFHYRQS
jgi:hypothetical protein